MLVDLTGRLEEIHRPFFEEWMEHLALLLRQYRRLDQEYHPFSEDEVASVSLLVAAAARANFLPIAEHSVKKYSRRNLAEKVRGRGDLWIARGEVTYALEVKRAFMTATAANLQREMMRAIEDLNLLDEDGLEYAFACLIAPVKPGFDAAVYNSVVGAEFRYAIGAGDEPDVFLYFKSW